MTKFGNFYKGKPSLSSIPPTTCCAGCFYTEDHQGIVGDKWRRPILEALVEMGGSGRVADILDRIHEKVKDQLTLADRQQLKTGETRWRNTAAWERLGMVKEGLLSDTSPKGVWEITQKGRDWLKSH